MSEIMYFICLILLGLATVVLSYWIEIRIIKRILDHNRAEKGDGTPIHSVKERINQVQMQLALHQQDVPAVALLQVVKIQQSEDYVNLLFVGDVVFVVLNCQAKGHVKISDDLNQAWKVGKKGEAYRGENPFFDVNLLARAMKRCDPTKKLRFVGVVYAPHLHKKEMSEQLALPRGIYLVRTTTEMAALIELTEPQGSSMAGEPLVQNMAGNLSQTIEEMIDRKEY